MLDDVTEPVLIDVPMPILTPRLRLRPVMSGDGAATAEAIAETWDQLNQWMIWAEKKILPEESEIHARRKYAQFILREDIPLIGEERLTGRPVIWTGLHRIDWVGRKFVIGYWVRASAQGRGYATESTTALIRYAFGALKAHRVEIGHAAANEKSRRVIEKAGFRQEALFERAARLPGGRWDDDMRYAVLSPEAAPSLDVRWGAPW